MSKIVTIFLYNRSDFQHYGSVWDTFNSINNYGNIELFNLRTVGKTKQPVYFVNAKTPVDPQYDINEVNKTDILIIPGGDDNSRLLADKDVIKWVSKLGDCADHILSIGSGSLILAKSGLLENHKVTAHNSDILELEELSPGIKIVDHMKYVDCGKVITSTDEYTAMDMCWYLAGELCEADTAKNTISSLKFK